MYGWLWRRLPGALGWKLTEALVLFVAAAAVLLFVVFPWVDPHLPLNAVTVPGQ